MWINLKALNFILEFYKKREERYTLLLPPKYIKEWEMTNIFFNNNPGYVNNYRTIIKIKKYRNDNNFFSLLQKKDQLLIKLFLEISKFYYYLFVIMLWVNSVNFLIEEKYLHFLNKNKLLKKKYILLINQNNLYFLKDKKILKKNFLLFKYFSILDNLKLFYNYYIFYIECFSVNFANLKSFLKLFFLKKCPQVIKLKIWEDCNYVINAGFVFFDKEERWIKNLEIFEEENSEFYDQIPLDIIAVNWKIHRFVVTRDREWFYVYLYFKYKVLLKKLNYIKFKVECLKKKEYIQKFYKLNKNFILEKILKKKSFCKKLIKFLPLFYNRIKLLKVIYASHKKIKELNKDEESLEVFKGFKVLNKKKEKIFYIIFFIIFLNFFKKKFFNKESEKNFLIIKKKFWKEKFLTKIKFLNFKLLFFLFSLFLFEHQKKIDEDDFIFLFYFFFLVCEVKLFKVYKGSQKILSTELMLKEPLIKNYYLNMINNFLFYRYWELIIMQFGTEIDDFFTKRYELLYEKLYYTYRNYWRFVNFRFFNFVKEKETILIKKLWNFDFFFLNERKLKNLYNIYECFSLNIWTLSEYKNLLENAVKMINFIVKKNKINITKYNKNKKIKIKNDFNFLKIYKNKKDKIALYLSFFLKMKNNFKLLSSNWNIMLKLYKIINKSLFKHLFKIFFFHLLYKKKGNLNIFLLKLPFFLKVNFTSARTYAFFLEKKRFLSYTVKFKKLIYSLFFINLLIKLKKNLKFNTKKIKYVDLYFIFFVFFRNIKWYKKKKLKKIILTKNVQLNQKQVLFLKKIVKVNNFIKKKNFLIKKLNFILSLKKNLYEKLLFFFKENFLLDILVILEESIISWNQYHDLGNDFELYNSSFVGKEYNLFFYNWFWYSLKSLLFFEIINLLLNKKFIILICYLFCNQLYYGNYQNFTLEHSLFSLSYFETYVEAGHIEKEDMEELKIPIEHFQEYFKDWLVSILDSLTNILEFRLEIRFFVKIGLTFWFNLSLDNYNLVKKNQFLLSNINKKLYLNKILINVYNYYLKKYFFFILKIKKEYIDFEDKEENSLKFSNNFFLKNFSYMNSLKFSLVVLNSIEFTINQIVCDICFCLNFNNVKIIQKIKYYQNVLKLNKINNKFMRFNFKLCLKCKCYKICIENQKIFFFDSYNAILKFYYLENIKSSFIFFNNKIQYCILKTNLNYLFFYELNFLNLNYKEYELKFFFCYLNNFDQNLYNMLLIWENFNFYLILVYYFFILEMKIFFKEPIIKNKMLPDTYKEARRNLKIQEEGLKILYKLEEEIPKKYWKWRIWRKKKRAEKRRLVYQFFENFGKGKV